MCRHLVLLLVGTMPILSIGCGADSVQEEHRRTLVETREAWGRAIAEGTWRGSSRSGPKM